MMLIATALSCLSVWAVPQNTVERPTEAVAVSNVFCTSETTGLLVGIDAPPPEPAKTPAKPAAAEEAPLPQPPVISPPEAGKAPSDAIVLFDGTLEHFTKQDGTPAGWKVNSDKTMTIVPGSGSIISKELFGDAQVHVEFATPSPAVGEGQNRGNSGVYLQGRYEVQVLDSFKAETYADGQCGALYKQYVPLVNVCRPPGEWQTYDIIFRAARFDAAGKRLEKARITVLHNGVLIHNEAELNGVTGYAPVKEAAENGPLYLQDHNCEVRYRNIWMRRLGVNR